MLKKVVWIRKYTSQYDFHHYCYSITKIIAPQTVLSTKTSRFMFDETIRNKMSIRKEIRGDTVNETTINLLWKQ